MEYQIITTREAADLLGVQPVTIHRYVKGGRLTPVYREDWQIDNTKLFYKSDVLKIKESLVKPGITTGEAAKILGVHQSTVSQYIYRGMLKAKKKLYRGRHIYFIKEDDLDTFKTEYRKRRSKERKDFFNKEKNYGWFQLFVNHMNEDTGRIMIINDKLALLTQSNGVLALDQAQLKGYQPAYSIIEHDYIHRKGYAKFRFPYYAKLEQVFFEFIDILYMRAGPRNIKMMLKNQELILEVKPILLKNAALKSLFVENIKKHIVVGNIIKRHNGIWIDSGLDTITFTIPTKLKELIIKEAEKKNLNLEDFVLNIVKKNFN